MTTDPNLLHKRLNSSSSLTDVLIQMEDFLDGLDLYVFKNWFEGEIVEGPDVRRYWVSMTLKYPYKLMPDPDGGMRLIKHGAKVFFRKSSEDLPRPVKSEDDFRPDHPSKPIMDSHPVWLVEIHIPRRFIEELDDDDILDLDDADTLSDARDEGISGSDDIANSTSDAEGPADTDSGDDEGDALTDDDGE